MEALISQGIYLNGPLTPAAHLKLVELVLQDGRVQAATARWVCLCRGDGMTSLADRASKAHHSPAQSAPIDRVCNVNGEIN